MIINMDVTAIPFNSFLGIKYSDDKDFILEIEKSDKYLNHINTVSAGAQFSLAEATSGEFLLRTFSEYVDNIVPVVRKVELKYKKPAEGRIKSKASMDNEMIEKVRNDIVNKGRSVLTVNVELFDDNNNQTLQSEFEWFVQKIK
jgi:acyl-coenzyme A thioesterase PaaI-like protein